MEEDDPQPDAFSTLYDPLRGLRQRAGGWSSKKRILLVVGLWVVGIAVALLGATHHL